LTEIISEEPDFAAACAAEETRLRRAGLRPTRQRVALGNILFRPTHRHVTAEKLHEEAQRAGIGVSLATVYNTLHQFTEAGLLRRVVVDGSKTYFDTNVTAHHHFYVEADGELVDIPSQAIAVNGLSDCCKDWAVERVDVIIRVRRKA
jgi:Fur family iron response transcriptional regulator